MKGKILFVVGLGVGYVLGTRAGRERYEQIRRAAQSVWNQPTVQRGVESAKGYAKSRVGDVSGSVLDSVKEYIVNAAKSAPKAKSTVRSAADTAKAGVDRAADAVEDAIDEAVEAAEQVEASGATAATKPRPPRAAKPATDS
ncbi:hypothetical protein ACDF64_05565 [Agromyces sp. MMS24-JH15]|uniref:hypothetical protein n=1 Tax=Agromyces sp. MMS24-JH15 TaxID=3243765 RepID=UPI00374983C2